MKFAIIFISVIDLGAELLDQIKCFMNSLFYAAGCQLHLSLKSLCSFCSTTANFWLKLLQFWVLASFKATLIRDLVFFIHSTLHWVFDIFVGNIGSLPTPVPARWRLDELRTRHTLPLAVLRLVFCFSTFANSFYLACYWNDEAFFLSVLYLICLKLKYQIF